MPIGKFRAIELRLKRYAKESAWAKYSRLKELSKHRQRCAAMRKSIDDAPPHISHHVMAARRRAAIEDVLGGAKNWIGKFEEKPKDVCDARPWRNMKNQRSHPAPFSTLKLSPRGDKLRLIERGLMELYNRIKEVEEMPSQYAFKKRTYLSRGESPYKTPPQRNTAEDKLEKIKKWVMKHHPKRMSTAPTGWFAALLSKISSAPPSEPPSRPASAPSGDGSQKKEPDPNSISSVTQEEADKDKKVAILKAVQEVGDPNF